MVGFIICVTIAQVLTALDKKYYVILPVVLTAIAGPSGLKTDI